MSIIVYSDGSHTKGTKLQPPTQTKGSVVIYKNGHCIDKATRLYKAGWSDTAEYVGILLGLERLIALNLQHESINWRNDSQFVMRNLRYRKTGKPNRDYYVLSCKCINLLTQFTNISFHWIPREANMEADALSKI